MSRISRKIWSTAIAVIFSMTIIVVVPAFASTVTSANDYASTLQAGQSSNHKVIFTTPNGATEGETIAIEFSSSFDTSTITEDDVDISDDGTDLTTATDCSGTEQASVTVAADAVTITLCAGDGGAIASASEVIIEIGTNATSSGTGANQITNPSGISTQYVSIAGTFSDLGSIVLPIGSDDSISIIAHVTASSPPDDTDRRDRIAPNIFNVAVSMITGTSALVTWDTDESADSKLDYGETVAYEIGGRIDTSMSFDHAIRLIDLEPGTEYHFEVRSADLAGNEGVSGDYTFITIDEEGPLIYDVEVVDITYTSARITWKTNEPADGVVEYGLTDAFDQSLLETEDYIEEHSLTLTELSQGTPYFFQIKAMDPSLNEVVSEVYSFTTEINLAPANVSNLQVTPSNQQNVLTWVNPEGDDLAGVVVTVCTDEFPDGPYDTDCEIVMNDFVEIFTHSGLSNGTTYYYGVFVYDSALQFSSGALGSGTPYAEDEDFEYCGNGICSETESADSCPEDCIIDDIVCGDGACTLPETAEICPADCSEPVNFCGDNYCAEDEDIVSCPADCAGDDIGFCGDGSCLAPETYSTCPADCTYSDEGPVCGNNICEFLETPDSCPLDCRGEVLDECGNGVCSFLESPTSCPTDCTEGGPVCGDGFCSETETEQSCPIDCGAYQPPEDVTPITGGGRIPSTEVEFYVANRLIQLIQKQQTLQALPIKSIYAQLLARNITKEVKRVELLIGSDLYLMAPNFSQRSAYGNIRMSALLEDAYIADVSAPASIGSNVLAVRIFYTDSTMQLIPFVLKVLPDGVVFEERDGVQLPVAGATITLLEAIGDLQVWDGSPTGQYNPVSTTSNGKFSWYVYNNNYSVMAQKSGYEEVQVMTDVVNNIVNPILRLVEVEDEARGEGIFVPFTDALTTMNSALNGVRAIPEVQQAAKISVPTLAVVTVASGIMLALAFDFIPFLQYIFSAPILFFWRRKRKGYGVVYNSISKEPVDLAIVRLRRVNDNKLLSTRVTDKGGRYFFLVQAGQYQIEVTKPGFVFSSEYLKEVTDDKIYMDVYHGEPIEVTENNAVITANIPVDPVQVQNGLHPRKKMAIRLRTIQRFVALVGVLGAIVFAVLRPTAVAFVMIAVQCGLYLLVQRLTIVKKPKSWGIVYDRQTGRPLSNVVARIFEPKYNKLLETAVTDSKGRYSFLLGPDIFFATFDKDGFNRHEIRPIDYQGVDEPTELSAEVRMNPKAGSTQTQNTQTKTDTKK
ncbi:MAG: fibronectin type III domain-containing protein [Patescibacteria group bacterium]